MSPYNYDEDPNVDDDYLGEDDDEPGTPRARRTRFGDGQKRNEAGRPPGSENIATIVRKIANQRIRVTKGGRKLRMSYLQILLIKIRNQAVTGDQRWIASYDKVANLSSTEPTNLPRGVLIVPEKCETGEQWEQRCQERLSRESVKEQGSTYVDEDSESNAGPTTLTFASRR